MAWKRGGFSRTSTAEHRKRKARVLRRDGYKCQIKGPKCLGRATILDHIIPVAFGGPDEDANCQAACEPCHAEKTQREAAEGRRRKRHRAIRPERHPGDDPTA